MDKIEKENYKLAWKWSRKLERGIRTIKAIQCEAFLNYLKANPLRQGDDEEQWKRLGYDFYRDNVYKNSIIGNITINDYHVDFISHMEGIPDDEETLRVGFKIRKDDWKLSNDVHTYVKFCPANLYNGRPSAWETNSITIHPSVENDIYKNVFPVLYKNMNLIIDDLKEHVHKFELSESARDFNVNKE